MQRRSWLRALIAALALALALSGPTPSQANQDRTITLGERHQGRLENAASVDNFRFQGRKGMVIRIRFTAEAGLEPAARLEVDNREVWFGGAPGNNVVDSGNLTLDSNNQYLLQVRSANGRSGGYLLDTASSDQSPGVSGAGTLTPGVPVSGWLSGPTTGQRYGFSARAGETLLLRVRSGEGLTPRITVQAPDGLLIWSGRARGPNQELILPPIILTRSGAYVVYITAAGTSGGTYELTMNLISPQ
jgi:hypothetical protein